MFNQREVITAVEIGSSKIVVLLGEFSPELAEDSDSPLDAAVKVIGIGEVAMPEQTVVKGDIVNMESAFVALDKAIESAYKDANVRFSSASPVAITFSGSDIVSQNYVGHVFIKNPDHKIGEEDIRNAIINAKNQVPSSRYVINSIDSWHVLDRVRKVKSPLEQCAREMDTYVHIIHGDSSRINNFINLVHDCGYEEDVSLIFSGFADIYGILSRSQCENGALGIDMGAGCTEYFTVYSEGVTSSGMIPIGMEHVANDLALAFDININHFRKILSDGTLSRALANNQQYLEHFAGKTKIPMDSINKVINARIRELMLIVYNSIAEAGALGNINSGAFLSGGGALLPNTGVMFREVFNMPYLIAQPFNYSARGGINIDSPRYSTVWGTLKFAVSKYREEKYKNSGMLERLSGGIDRIWSISGDLLKSLKGIRI